MAEVVVTTGSLQGYSLPFSSSSSELDGEYLFCTTKKLIPQEV